MFCIILKMFFKKIFLYKREAKDTKGIFKLIQFVPNKPALQLTNSQPSIWKKKHTFYLMYCIHRDNILLWPIKTPFRLTLALYFLTLDIPQMTFTSLIINFSWPWWFKFQHQVPIPNLLCQGVIWYFKGKHYIIYNFMFNKTLLFVICVTNI